MRTFVKALLISAAATGVAALLLDQLDLDAAEPAPESDFPGPNPENMDEEAVESLLNELAAQL